jgi:hypothetical protein
MKLKLHSVINTMPFVILSLVFLLCRGTGEQGIATPCSPFRPVPWDGIKMTGKDDIVFPKKFTFYIQNFTLIYNKFNVWFTTMLLKFAKNYIMMWKKN